MKLNATPRHYMPLPQNQSDDEESGPSKEEKLENLDLKNSYDTTNISHKIRDSMTEDDLKNLPMSPLRIVMFILSLIMCVLFVAIFVCFIPCTSSDNLDTSCHLSSRWTKVFHNMSFSSLLAIVKSDLLEDSLVIVGYTNEESGLLAFQERNGQLQWQLPLHSAPSSCICDIIDANGDGLAECLIVGDNGLLTAVDIRKGASLWYLHNHSDLSSASSISEPTVLPDCDGDNIPELAISYNLSDKKGISYLALVSGGTGRIIGPLLDLPQCTGPVLYQLSWEWRNKTDFVFYCAGEKTGYLWILPSKSMCSVAQNKTEALDIHKFYRVPHVVSDIQFYKIKSKDDKLKYQLMVVLDGVEFICLERFTKYNFKTLWKISSQHHARIVTEGEFLESIYQLLIVSSNSSHSMVLGLNVDDGTEVWSFSQENQTITSVMKLSKFFNNVDGILLKSFTPFQFDEQLIDVQNSENSLRKRRITIKNEGGISNDNDLTAVEENYILLKAGNSTIQKFLDTKHSWIFCKDNSCKPDMFIKNTAFANRSEGSSLDIVIVSSTYLPMNNTIVGEEMTITLSNLERVMNVSSCAN